MTQNDQTRIEELLAGRALGDLNRDETRELDALLLRNPGLETDEFDRTAAAVASLSVVSASLPEALSSRIRMEAPHYIPTKKLAAEQALYEAALSDRKEPSSVAVREIVAWAIAASLLFAFLSSGFFSPSDQPTPAEARLAMLERADDVITIDWGEGPNPFSENVKGDVVWSNQQQRGYMRFVDMPLNDPTKEQYQLWIIDPERDVNPIDGGVFDVTSDGEVIVPIDAKLKVVEPQAFAITIEKSGGVVVSARDRLPLIASVER